MNVQTIHFFADEQTTLWGAWLREIYRNETAIILVQHPEAAPSDELLASLTPADLVVADLPAGATRAHVVAPRQFFLNPLSAEEGAQELGVSPQQVRDYCRTYKDLINPLFLRGAWRIPRTGFEEFRIFRARNPNRFNKV